MSVGSTTAAVCDCSRPESCVERHVGRYLAAVYWLTVGHDDRARTGEVSDRLGVSPASVTETFGRLAADGLVDYEKRGGVELTGRGETVARELVRRQCVVRTFFGSELDVELSAETGYRIGFVLPGEGIERLRGIVEHRPDGCCRDDDREDGDRPFGVGER